ncbi:MAG: AAA family ATPase [Woeseiaceae bacterium]|nr:AAA family ATPase [Woeseiaceae bacterium]
MVFTDSIHAATSDNMRMQIIDSLIRHGRPRDACLDSDLVAGLLSPEAYPHAVERVELVQTHISWVLLTGEFAYKVKKPVELGFLDFRQLGQRRYFCEEELRLNRFWAPDLYLDVVPIVQQDGCPRVGGNGPAIEYAVRMRQFDQALRLDNQLEASRLSADDMLELATEVAARHHVAERVGPAKRLQRVTRRLMWDNFDDLVGEVPQERIAALHRWTKASLSLHETQLRERCDKGFYRECHGDLHLGNIVRLAGGIRAFDCIEFSEDLRRIDVVADYGFLVMDLEARGRIDLAYTFLNRYLEVCGDYGGVTLLPLYVVYRCLVRAKVAAIRRRERALGESRDEDTATLEHYCELAQAWTRPRTPVLVVMTGLSGSGKTWLSTRLLTALPALRIRSDLERKRLYGLEEKADSHSGIASGLYDRTADHAVYERVFECARSVLVAGFDLIVDAAFLDAGSRKQARQLAAECGAGFVLVQAAAPLSVLQERLQRRAAAGSDASEAGLAVLQHQRDTADPLDSSELASAVTVPTDAEVKIAAVAAAVRKAGRVHPAC